MGRRGAAERISAMQMLKPGDPCPCCGQPIKSKDPAVLQFLTWIKGNGYFSQQTSSIVSSKSVKGNGDDNAQK